jgi:hypothetical protein
MKSLAGPMMLLVIVVGFFLYRTMSAEAAPSRDFTEAELAGPTPDYDGTCYSLSTVFIANGVFGNVPRTWSSPRKGAWALTLERVADGGGGPVREFQTWTFEQHGEQVRMVEADASQGYPKDIEENLNRLLEAPNARGSTPVDRCAKDGGTGYRYKKKK